MERFYTQGPAFVGQSLRTVALLPVKAETAFLQFWSESEGFMEDQLTLLQTSKLGLRNFLFLFVCYGSPLSSSIS